jgi:DNA-binding NarL/FixJ family response regulator
VNASRNAVAPQRSQVTARCHVQAFLVSTLAALNRILKAHMKNQKNATTTPTPKEKDNTKTRIVIIDDHSLVRDGLAGLLGSKGFIIAGSAGSAPEGLELVRKTKPDLAILDMSLAKSDGLELIKQIRAERPSLPILVISMHDENIYAERVLRAGARGYVMKREPSEKIFAAIAEVLRGELAVSNRVKQEMLSLSVSGKRTTETPDSFLSTLSDREMEVFQMIGQGIRTRDIAERLHLSVKTIESYRENLKLKLNLPDGATLVYRAIQWNRSQPLA